MKDLLPRIWYGTAAGWTKCLRPPLAVASLFYGIGLRIDQSRKAKEPKKLPRPVISIGNLTVGGTGKTPLVLFLAQTAEEMNWTPCILTRGYGARTGEPRRVDPEVGDWRVFGDEPLFLAEKLKNTPVWTGRNRFESGTRAISESPEIDLFVLDDGFQHRRLARDVDIVLVDGERGFGNGHLLPWGPLREPVQSLERADFVGLLAKSEGRLSNPLEPFGIASLDFRIELAPSGWYRLGEEEIQPISEIPRDRPAHLVSGVGSPQSFEKTVKSLGLSIFAHSIYEDHHAFTADEIERETERASAAGTRVFTTEKDAVRMRSAGVVWTNENRPIIIQLALTAGDGAEFLKRVLSETISGESSSEIKISGGRTES